jgi:hypothetical protein
MTYLKSLQTHLGRAALLALTSLLQACAYINVDTDGTRHILGFVKLTLPPANAQGGQAMNLRAIGLSITHSEAGSALALGYSSTTLAFVRNHSIVPASALLLDRHNTQEISDEATAARVSNR